MRAVVFACLVASACGGEERPLPRAPRPPAAQVESASPAPLPESAFRAECEPCEAARPPSRFETHRIGEGEPRGPRFTGRRVNLDLKDADLQEAFRLVADVGKVNIVVAGEVTGKVTLRLREVPWDQAIDVIARAKGLVVEREGNVLFVRAGSAK